MPRRHGSSPDSVRLGTEVMLQLAVFGLQEMWPILIVVLILFGARKLPELARAMGSSVNEFKKGMNHGAEGDEKAPEASKAVEAKEK